MRGGKLVSDGLFVSLSVLGAEVEWIVSHGDFDRKKFIIVFCLFESSALHAVPKRVV